MLKAKTVLEVKIDERIYELSCNPEAPLGGVHDALCQMKAYIVQRIIDQQEAEKKKDEPQVEECPKSQ